MIAHIDADAFFASVLQRKYPHLKGKPLLAQGMGGSCVIAASYEAKAKGVKTGMRLTEAKKLCPEAISVPSEFRETGIASKQIEKILNDECPVIEQMSIDEWFLDLRSLTGGIPSDILRWAKDVQRTVSGKVGINVSVGIAPSKLLAKMASEYRKPAGVTIVDADMDVSIEEFLKDRPAEAISGIGPRRSIHTKTHNWKSAWDIANANKETVVHLFGKTGDEMQRELLGEEVFAVEEDTRPPKSISRCRSFHATKEIDLVFSYLLDHLSYTIMKMRRHNLACNHITVFIRDGDYRHWGMQRKLPQSSDTEDSLMPQIEYCFKRLLRTGRSYTQVGLALQSLKVRGSTQYSLFDDTDNIDDSEHVQKALDDLHERFGRRSIIRGAAIPTKRKSKPDLIVWE